MEKLSASSGYVILFVFSFASIALGKWFAKGTKETTDDFLAARESIPMPVAIAGLIAVWIWSSTIMGSGEGAYTFGMGGLWMYGLVVPISAVALGAPILGKVRRMIPRASTFPQYIALRMGKGAHGVFTVVGIWQMFFWSVLQVMAVGMVLDVMFGIPPIQGAFLSGIVITVYITLGGLRAAAGTAFVQVLVVTLLMAILVPMAVFMNGGPVAIYQGVANSGIENATALVTPASITGWFLVSLGAFINYSIMDQNVWQYVYSTTPGKERKLILTTTFLWFCFPATAGLLGIIALGAGIKVTPALAVPTLILNTLPKWMAYAFALIMLSSIYSTAGSCLNAFTSIIINDVYIPYFKKGNTSDSASLLKVAKTTTLLGGLGVAVLSVAPVSLLFFNYAVGAIAVPLTWPFVLSVFWEKLNIKAATWGMVLGVVCGTYFAFFPAIGWIQSPVELWVGYAITHAVSFFVPLIGTLVAPNRDFTFAEMVKNTGGSI